MKREIFPKESSRSEAFRLWMSSPMPMVTLVKTLDVSRLVKVGKKSGMKVTTLMCWCIGKAASQIEEFYTLPENGKLFQYDKLAFPMHQHIRVVNFMPLFLPTFTKQLTSSVFTSVTIGMGDDIHRRNASARLLSWGDISLFIPAASLS